MICKCSDLKSKEVVNVNDGRKLGCISDFEFLLPDGRIEAIIVPGQLSIANIFKGPNNIIIPWCNICKIGSDVILVDLPKQYYIDTHKLDKR